MAYPLATSRVLEALGYVPLDDFTAQTTDGTTVELTWTHVDTQPSDSDVNDYATDTTVLPSGQLFSVWLSENGGDETLTNRRVAIDIANEVNGDGVRVRALIELLNKRDNYLTNRVLELQARVQAMLSSTGGVANMRTDGLAVSISETATRTKADAVQDYRDDIDAGNQDN